MKKVLVITVLAAAALLLASCAAQKDPNTIKIGMLKLATFPSFDAMQKGIEDELIGQGLKVEFDEQDAKGEMDSAVTFAKKFQDEKDKVVIGLGAPPSRALIKQTQGIPVVFAGVTDPVGAGLLASTTAGDGRVSGVSDQTVVKEQLALLVKWIPSVKKIGMIFAGAKGSEGILTRETKQACTDLGLSLVMVPVADSTSVESAAKFLVSRVDAFFVAPDSTVVASLPAISAVAKAAKKPLIADDIEASKTTEVLFAWQINYYKVGLASGRLIEEILKGTAPSSTPVRYLTNIGDVDFLVNLDSATSLGITVPPDVLQASRFVIQNGSASEK